MASFGSRPLPMNGGSNSLVLLQNRPSHGGRPAAAAASFCRENGAGSGRSDFRVRFPAKGGMSEVLVGLEKGRGIQATREGGVFGKEKKVKDEDGADGNSDSAVQASVDKRKKAVKSRTQASSLKSTSAEADKDASPAKSSRTFSSKVVESRTQFSSLKKTSAEADKDAGASTKSSRIPSSTGSGTKGRYNGSTASNVSVQSPEPKTTKTRRFGIPGIWPKEAERSGGDRKQGKPAVADAPESEKDAEAASKDATVSAIDSAPTIKDTEHEKETKQQEEPAKEKVDATPLAGVNVMNVILVAAECAPWSKTGGLGDVAGALPKALARRGHRVMVVVPRYGHYAEPKDLGVRKRYKVAGQDMEVSYHHAYVDGVDFVFLDSPIFSHRENNIYGGERVDILKRMILFCKAAVEVPWHVPCGGICYGDGNLAFIANDWHTALLPVYLKAYYRDNGLMMYTRSVLVIHNIAHQGRGPMEDFCHVDLPEHYMDMFRLYDPVGGEHFNIFAAGLKTADRIVTVSHGYAWELKTSEGGWGLHEMINENHWKLRGIVNGIDTDDWDPEADAHLKSDGYANYSAETLDAGKARCKEALQRELGLPVRGEVPLIGFIGRLDQQKGVDLIAEAMPWIAGQEAQLVLLGTGRDDLEEMLRRFEREHGEKVRGWVGFSVRMAHRITAGADVLLMPSRFEPCGLNQLYAMRYGTVPVVHAVGGLRDTVLPFDPFREGGEGGYGWTFDRAEANKLINALGNCLNTYRHHKDSWRGLQRRGMAQDLSWDCAAKNYEEVLVEAKYQW